MGCEPKYLPIISLMQLLALLALAGCGPAPGVESFASNGREQERVEEREQGALTAVLTLPEVEAADLGGAKLRVVATTTIIGDVVGRVGGEAIELTTLMGPGQDPHGYEPAARTLTAVADAHVIFVNGWDLEEGLIDTLKNVAGDAPLVPVSAHITPLLTGEALFGGEGENSGHAHQGVDPHVWLNPQLVKQWVANIVHVMSELDPANATTYESNARTYLAELEALIAYYDERIASIPQERRKLVTNHDALGYFAQQYGFEVIGTVIPSTSTVAEPSAAALAELVRTMRSAGVCTIFAESTVNPALSETVVTELDECEAVKVLTLYTGALGPEGSGADSYIGMMRVNIDTILGGLK